MPKDEVVAGLDIGTTKVVMAVAEVEEEGRLNIIGLGEVPSAGLRKGIIVDIEHTAQAVARAAAMAERMSGYRIRSAYVGITGSHIQSLNNRGVVAVAGENREIEPEDVKRVLQAARVIPLAAERQIVHVLPRQYIVDGYDGIIDPVGMTGSRLEVETHIVTAAGAAVQNLLKSVQRAGLEVEQLVLNPLASAEAVLQPAEKELGAVVVDVGGGTTEIAVVAQGGLWFASVLPVGGDHITSDIAVGLRTPLSQAEKIKKEWAAIPVGTVPDNELLPVPNVGGHGEHTVSKKMLASVIQPRVEEILTLVHREIGRAEFKGLLPGGAVLTGGGSLLPGMAELAGEILQLPVRVGAPCRLGGLADMVSTPAYATSVGLLIYGARSLGRAQAAAGREPVWWNLWTYLKGWLRELFQ
ncbi:MAG: cell division protein FtsA [Thermoanaerobacteraceae bacterium]|nr:cell division protein FtsA [Thermoanaerobacteraceae bacterium]